MTPTPIEPPDFDSLWDYDDPAGTEAKFRALLPSVAPGSAAHVELLTQIARSQGLQRQFAAAHQTLDQAHALLTEGAARPCIRCHLERGRVFNSSGHQPEASAQFRAAWQLATAACEDFYAVDAAHMLGISEPASEQSAWNRRAIAAAEQSSQPRTRQWLGSLYNNQGWTLHDQGDFPQALDLFERALCFRQAQAKPSEILIARWCVARCLRSLGRWTRRWPSSKHWPPRMPLPAPPMTTSKKSWTSVGCCWAGPPPPSPTLRAPTGLCPKIRGWPRLSRSAWPASSSWLAPTRTASLSHVVWVGPLRLTPSP